MTEQASEPFVEVFLSRPSYRVGEAVVGTIRFVPPQELDSTNSTSSNNTYCLPRDIFSDAYLYVAGYCRLDPRWHTIEDYAKSYESPAIHDGLHNRKSANGNVVIDEKCVCFWTTSVINLMELKERTIGRWEDVKPKSLRKTASKVTDDNTENDKRVDVVKANLQVPIGGAQGNQENTTNSLNNKNDQVGGESNGTSNHCSDDQSPSICLPLEHQQLAFTFRADLPLELPPSIRLNSCRYFYSVMVGTRARMPNVARKQWIRHSTPVQVFSLSPNHPPPIPPDNNINSQQPHQERLPMGSCFAMAHAVGLPCHVTATDLHQPTGQIHVNRQGTASLGALVKNNHTNNLQTMRITDLQGNPCCVLTAIGVSVATPGSRMMLKFDFSTPQQQQDAPPSLSSWTPCYQVSASLEGEEVVIHADGSRKRTRAYQFDTAYQAIDPECTERVCLSLLMPLDAPTTLRTNVVEMEVHLCIDITVGNNHTTDQTTKHPLFNNLRLQLPCRVVHSLSEYELVLKGENNEDNEDDAMKKLPLDELIFGAGYRNGHTTDPDEPPLIETKALRNTHDMTHPSSFPTKDIRQDLKLLSIQMAKTCDLVVEG